MAKAASLPYPEENEFKISKAQLVNALSIVMKAVSTKTSSVILESILIASDNRAGFRCYRHSGTAHSNRGRRFL